MRKRRGQTSLLFALTLLLVVLMVCMTVAVGQHIKRKMELQAVADAAAYSNAVATARAYNTYSLLNRTMISHWVAISGVQALVAFGTTYQSYLNGYAAAVQELKRPNRGPACAAATARPTLRREPGNPEIDEADNFFECRAVFNAMRGCSPQIDRVTARLLDAATDAFPQGWGRLDAEAAAELKAVRAEIRTLGAIQLQVHADLEAVLREQKLSQSIVELAAPGSGDFRVLTGNGSAGSEVAWREAGNTDGSSAAIGATDARAKTHRHSMVMNAMVSRGSSFLVSGYGGHPPKVDEVLARIQRDFPRFDFFSAPQAPSSWRTDTNAYFSEANRWRGDSSAGLGWGSATTYSWGDVHVAFNGCGPTMRRTSHVRALLTSTADGESRHWWTGHRDSVSANGESRNHHPGERPDAIHNAGANDGYGVFTEGLGFLFPSDPYGDAWGQPKLPVVLNRTYDGTKDPWNLSVRLSFAPGAEETSFEMQKSGTQTAISTGIAYYHRREHWAEPPNFLNPFWRATLVPVNVDERYGHQNGDSDGVKEDAARMLNANGDPVAASVYAELRKNGFKGLQ